MAVYTTVSTCQAQALCDQLQLGRVIALQGIEGGIENTNYFLSTEQSGPQGTMRLERVLTVFERLTHAQLPFYLRFKQHLAERGVAVPKPQATATGELVLTLGFEDGSANPQGKPVAVVSRLAGKSDLRPGPSACAQMGGQLARLHLAGQGFAPRQPNLRALAWWNEAAKQVLPHLSPEQASLVQSELAFQNHTAQSAAYAALPSGAVHCDAFRDNVLFENGQLTGVFDFYFAGTDHLAFDLAVVINDWCLDWSVELPTARLEPARLAACLAAYQAERPLTRAERSLLPAMLRAAALRFWISRLWDWHLPREASLLKPHDPTHFERIVRERTTLQDDALGL